MFIFNDVLRPLVVIALVVPVGLSSSMGIAQTQGEAITEESAEERRKTAETFNAEARKAFIRGDHKEAIRLWQSALEKSVQSKYHFNIGQTYVAMSRCQKAIQFFNHAIQSTTDQKEQAKIADRIVEVQGSCKEAPLESVPGEAPRLPPEGPSQKLGSSSPREVVQASRTNLMPYAWTSWGLSAGAIALGSALIAIHIPISRDGALLPEYRLTRTPGIAIASAGGALLLTGLILWLVDAASEPTPEPVVLPQDASAAVW